MRVFTSVLVITVRPTFSNLQDFFDQKRFPEKSETTHKAMPHNVQSDFSPLNAASWQNDALDTVSGHYMDRSLKLRKRTLASEFTKETLLSDCHAAPVTIKQPVQASMSLVAVSESLEAINYEPTRHFQQAAPPKRFYRTFWRSITRRMLQADRSHAIRVEHPAIY